MVVTHFVFGGRVVTVVRGVGRAVVTVGTGGGSFSVTVATGLAREVCISALLARAVLSWSLISSIFSCSSSSSPGLGGTTAAGGGATDGGGGDTAAGGVAMAAGGGAAAEGGAEEEEEGRDSTRLAKEAAGPPFSQSRAVGPTLRTGDPSPRPPAPPPLAPRGLEVAATRARRRRVLRVSRLKWTRLLSLPDPSAASLLLSLFHLADSPGTGGGGA